MRIENNGYKWLSWLGVPLLVAQMSRYLSDLVNEDLIYLDLLFLCEIYLDMSAIWSDLDIYRNLVYICVPCWEPFCYSQQTFNKETRHTFTHPASHEGIKTQKQRYSYDQCQVQWMDKDLECTCDRIDRVWCNNWDSDVAYGDAIISIRDRKVYFRAWDIAFDCTIPEDSSRSSKNGNSYTVEWNYSTKDDIGSNEILYQRPVATAIRNFARSEIKTHAKGPRDVRKDDTPEYYRELLLKEFDDILTDQLSNKLPPLRDINHYIPYKPTKPWIAHKYRLPEAHKQALEKDVKAKSAVRHLSLYLRNSTCGITHDTEAWTGTIWTCPRLPKM